MSQRLGVSGASKTSYVLELSLATRFQDWLESAAQNGIELTGAESLTGGLVSAHIVACPGASRVFLGSYVTYSRQFKAGALGVRRDLLENQGAVDPEVVAQMAVGAQARALGLHGESSGKIVAFATTGVAGPEASEGKAVGLVYVAVANQYGDVLVKELEFSGSRNEIRQKAAEATLQMLMEQIPAGVS